MKSLYSTKHDIKDSFFVAFVWFFQGHISCKWTKVHVQLQDMWNMKITYRQ